MNKLFVLGFILLGIGAAFFSVGTVKGEFNTMSESQGYLELVSDADVSGDIYLDMIVGNVSVSKGDVSEVRLSYNTTRLMEYEIVNDVDLTINQNHFKRQWYDYFNFNFFNNYYFNIIVPNDFNQNLTINIIAGNVNLTNFDLAKINLNITSGNINLDNVLCDEFSLDLTSGTTNLKDLDTNICDLQVTSGTIGFTNLKANDINIILTSGLISGSIGYPKEDYKITITKVAGISNIENGGSGSKDLNINITSGAIQVSFTE